MVGLAMVPYQPTISPDRSSAAVSGYQVAEPRLTSEEVHTLEHPNHAQATRLSQELDKALRQFGMQAGIGTGSATKSGPMLDTMDWSVGINLTHAWVIASYANLWPYKQAINKLGKQAR